MSMIERSDRILRLIDNVMGPLNVDHSGASGARTTGRQVQSPGIPQSVVRRR